MDNTTFKVLVFALLLVFSFLFAYIVGKVVGYDLLFGAFSGEFDQFSAQFLSISIAFPVLFFIVGYHRFGVALVAALVLALASGWFITAATDITVQFGIFLPYALFVVFYGMLCACLRWVWMNPRIRVLKGLRFSLLASAGYSILLIAIHLFSGEHLDAMAAMQYFYYSLIVFISETVAVTLAERVYLFLGRAWRVPDFMEEDKDDKDE